MFFPKNQSHVMKRILSLFFIFVSLSSFESSEKNTEVKDPIASVENSNLTIPRLPERISGETVLKLKFQQFPKNTFSWEAFKYALLGRQALSKTTDFSDDRIITIVDFSKPSTQERLYVLDLADNKILFQSLVAHGKNTGENWATHFSNQANSYQSSLGFYKTAEIYNGSKGCSMKLDGLESSINGQARNRGIVVHAADYVSKSFVQQYGRLGRSQGCPALPRELNKPIIQKISGGTLFFIYAPNQKYLHTSDVLKSSDIQSFSEEKGSAPVVVAKG